LFPFGKVGDQVIWSKLREGR